MANTRAANVLRVDTTADFTGVGLISSVKYIGNTSGTAIIKKKNTAGARLWEADGTTDVHDSVYIRCPQGIRVEVTNGAVVYLYLSRD